MFIGSNVHAPNVSILMGMAGAASNGTSYLLDTYGTDVFAAYTLFKAKTGQTNVIRLYEDGTATETDIAIDADTGWVDEDAMTTHTGANNGLIADWYDATGNGWTATQGTVGQMPQIVASGVVIKKNGKPAAKRVGTTSNLKTADFGTTPYEEQPNTFFTTYYYGGGAGEYPFSGNSALYDQDLAIFAGAYHAMYGGAELSDATVPSAGHYLSTCLFNTTSSVMRRNSSQVAAGNVGTETARSLTICGRWVPNQPVEYFQNLIFYNADKTSDFAAIEAELIALHAFPASDSYDPATTSTDSGSTTEANFTDRWTEVSNDGTASISGGNLSYGITNTSTARLTVSHSNTGVANASGDFVNDLTFSNLSLGDAAGSEDLLFGIRLYTGSDWYLIYVNETSAGLELKVADYISAAFNVRATEAFAASSGVFTFERSGNNLYAKLDGTTKYTWDVTGVTFTKVSTVLEKVNSADSLSVDIEDYSLVDGSGDPINLNFN